MTKPTRAKSSESGYERKLAEEALIVDATELISELMAAQGVNRSELAKRIGKARGFVTQVLAGNRNMTLRTLADLAHSLDARVTLAAQPVESLYGQQVIAAQTIGSGAIASAQAALFDWLSVVAVSREDILAWESARVYPMGTALMKGSSARTLPGSATRVASVHKYGSTSQPRLKVIQGRAA